MASSRRRTHRRSLPPGARPALVATALLASCDGPLDPRAQLLLSELTVEFEAVAGSQNVVTRTVTVQNAGGGRLGPVSCPGTPAAWLTCEVTDGLTVLLTADPSGLSEDPDPVSVPFSAPGLSAPVPVVATLTLRHPALALSTTVLSFSAPEGAETPIPATATVTVTNAGAGTLADLGTLACAPSDARVVCDVEASTGILSVSVNPDGLAGGTYLFEVSVTGSNAEARTFTVTLDVAAAPRIVLSEGSVHFDAIRGSEIPMVRAVTVSNSGVGSLGTVACPADPAPWLTCAFAGGVLTLTADPTGLTLSPPAVDVLVTATEAENSPQSLTVRLTLEQPLLALDPPLVTLTVPEGAEDPLPPVRVDLLNVGAGVLPNLGEVTCTVPDGAPFVCDTETDDPDEWWLSLHVPDPVGLPPGVTVHSVSVTAEHSSGSQPLAVVLNVAPPSPITASPDALAFVFEPDDTDPEARIVELSHSGGSPLGTLSCAPQPAAWLTCAVDSDEDGEWFVFTAFPALLSETPDPVVVEVSASEWPDDPATVAVSAILLQEMSLDEETVAFTVSAGGESTVPPGTPTTPATRTVTVQNESGGSLEALGELSCIPGSRVSCPVEAASGAVTMSIDPEGLAPGTHFLVAQIAAEYGSNSPRPLVIVVTVDP